MQGHEKGTLQQDQIDCSFALKYPGLMRHTHVSKQSQIVQRKRRTSWDAKSELKATKASLFACAEFTLFRYSEEP